MFLFIAILVPQYFNSLPFQQLSIQPPSLYSCELGSLVKLLIDLHTKWEEKKTSNLLNTSYTLEINMLPLKRDHLKRKVVFQHFFKGHVSFPGEGCTVATLRYGLHPEVHLATGRRSRCANHLQPVTRSPLSTC